MGARGTGSAIAVCALGILLAAGGAASAGAPGDLQAATPLSVGANPAPLQNLADAAGRGEFPKTTSVLVVYRNKLIYERYFGDGSPALLNDTRSATKSITALAVGEAIHDGAVGSVASPAFSYLTDLAPFGNDTAPKRGITIEDFLTMSSALDCNDDVDASPGNEDRMYEQSRWTRWAVDLPTKAGYRRDDSGRGPFSYCTAGAFLLGQIVQRATHTPVDHYIEQKILGPLGISQWEWPRSPSGEVMTGGGLRLRSRDLAKLVWMLVNDGVWDGRTIVPSSWVTAAMTAHRKANPAQDYGYLFWQRSYATKCGAISGWYMSGNGGNAIVALKDLDAAIVVTRENYNTHNMHQQTVDLLEHYVLPAIPCATAVAH
jgi:CubicO group peptidase (beta-lactamase class C family)